MNFSLRTANNFWGQVVAIGKKKINLNIKAVQEKN